MRKQIYLCALVMFLALFLSVPTYAVDADPGDSPDGGSEEGTGTGDGDQDDGEDDGADTEKPSYANAAQAMHAANLAEKAATQPDPATAKAAAELESAQEAYDAVAQNPENVEALEATEKELDRAREAYADAVGELAGTKGQNISKMREEGMGWGQIAKELGVHPRALGLGHGKKKSKKGGTVDVGDDAEIAEATKRDTKTGWTKNHGLSTSGNQSAKKGLGLNETSVAANERGLSNRSSKSQKDKGARGSSASSSGKSGSSSRGKDGGPSGSGNSSDSGNSKDKSDKGNNKDKGDNGKGKGKK